MHLPRALARFNRYVTNPIQRRWAGVIPLHGILEHTGRKSGRSYRTPVLVFGRPGGFAITIGYGLRSDWVRNLLAAGGGGLTHRRRHYVLTEPRVLTGKDAVAALPKAGQVLARLVGIEGVLVVDAAAD
ncbi:MAG TPA: nitroreductase family deazaflavin-dependent oxidoreductase [Jatrophihabitantaceae bacterium]|jgi:deazaflavin-dependent oxidoreductase (nitroreductase family)|nr:nitroreductase family deazaflavin-dependent oxidoreductase [Jatrophihabitantaceae bacterium]